MICLRCGQCCKTYMVVIVDDPEKGLVEDNLVGYKGDSRCQHLQGDEPGGHSCAVHDYPWYKETPCFQHDQIGQPGAECRLGRFLLDNPTLEDFNRKREKAP